jgi:hypothetical protein
MATRDVHALIIVGNLCGQPCENVLHFNADVNNEVNPLPTSHHLISAWQATGESAFLDPLPQNYRLIGYRAKRVNHSGGPSFTVLAAGGTIGGQPVDATDSAIGPVIISSYFDPTATPHHPAGAWRSGRLFMPGIDSSNITNNAISVGVSGLLTTFISTVLDTPLTSGGNTFDFGVWSPGDNVIYDPVSFSISLKPGVQGRRLKPV